MSELLARSGCAVFAVSSCVEYLAYVRVNAWWQQALQLLVHTARRKLEQGRRLDLQQKAWYML